MAKYRVTAMCPATAVWTGEVEIYRNAAGDDLYPSATEEEMAKLVLSALKSGRIGGSWDFSMAGRRDKVVILKMEKVKG